MPEYLNLYHDRCEKLKSGSMRGYKGKTNHKKVKVKVTLEQATKAQRGSRGIDILFL
jgi:hypothetical protein